MNNLIDGFWRAGFWEPNFWVDGFWEEGIEHHGKGDNERGRKKLHLPVKPTGLSVRKNVKIDQLVKEQQEVVSQVLKRRTVELVESEVEIVQMSMAEIDFEIKTLLYKQFRTQEDEAMLLILLAANI